MENTKKIMNTYYIWYLFLCTFISCKMTKNNTHYYNEQGSEINVKDLDHIKFNIYEDHNKEIYLLSEKIIRKIDEKEKITSENIGYLLQDSILINNEYKNIAHVVDINSYKELYKDLLYLDNKNVYYNFKSDMSSYPYGILDLNPTKVILIEGYFIKDNKNVYNYGGISCMKLNNINANSFYVKKFKNVTKDDNFYLAFDDRKIFHNADELTLADLEETPISKKSKDSLKIIYFH